MPYMETNLYPRFITNSPQGEDLFESGSQKRTSESIANHIKKELKDYKLIGLDGNWGSGKSNVISIIQKDLGDDYHLFIYDAWSHQEDLQRRSFLEALLESLHANKILPKEQLEYKLNDLLAKRKSTITKTIPKLSYPLVISFLVIVLTPIAKIISDSVCATYLKVIITASPILAALIVWLYVIFIKKQKEYSNILNLFYFYKEQTLEKNTDEVISEQEPSIREFRNWMKGISDELIMAKKNIIIVFDNMDRLPPQKVQTLWSSIHTFFSETNYNNIWVIVPFDRIHIKDAFSGKNAANHFIDKTFSVIFRVSPPVLSDWKQFFSIKYNEAFDTRENEEREFVMNVFDLYTNSITPRKIIAFINEMVSLKLIWENDIALRYIAVFILNKEAFEETPTEVILGATYLEKAKHLFRGDESLSNYIAALLYNVPVEMASQVSLYREILIDIRDKNKDKLLKISENKQFKNIIEEVLSKEIYPIDSAVLMLNEFDCDNKFKYSWTILNGRFLENPIDDQLFTEVHKILILKVSKPETIIKHIINQIGNVEQFSGTKYFKAIDELNNFLKAHKLEINLFELLPDKIVTAPAFSDYIIAAQERVFDYKVSCKNEEFDKFIKDAAIERIKICETLKYITSKYTFPVLAEYITSQINAGSINLDNLSDYFNAYKIITNKKPFTVLLTDPLINDLLNKAETDSQVYYELAAMRLSRFDNFASWSGVSQSILTLVDKSLVEEVANRIEFYVAYGTILTKSLVWEQPFLKAVIQDLTLKSRGESSMDIELVLSKFKAISKINNLDQMVFLKRVNPWHNFLKSKLNKETFSTIIPDVSFLELLFQETSELGTLILEIAEEFVVSENWNDNLEEISEYKIQLMKVLLENDKITGLPDKAQEALKATLFKLVKFDTEISTEVRNTLLYFYEKSEKVKMASTIQNIRDALLLDAKITKSKFLLFEKLFLLQGDLTSRCSDVVRKIFTPVMQYKECADLIILNEEFYISILERSGDVKFDFLESLRKLIETNETDVKYISFEKRVCALFDIKIIKGRYFSNEKDNDITEFLKSMIEVSKTRHFEIQDNIFGPDYILEGNSKKLEVHYIFNEIEHKKIFNEGDWFKVP